MWQKFYRPSKLKKHLLKVHNLSDGNENTWKENVVTNPAEQIVNPILNLILTNQMLGSSRKRNWIYKCTFCLKVCNGMKLYYDHILSYHPFQCNVCDASFVSNFRLSTHQKIHYQCNICKVYLLSDFHLRSHIEDQHVTKARNDKQDSKLGFD